MFRFKPFLSLVLLGLMLSSQGWSQSSGAGSEFSKRAERRQTQRWTLQEWLLQKDRNRMMDLWLSMNSPSPYELMLGMSHNSYTLDNSTASSQNNFVSYQGSFSAYAQFVGLSVEYENNTREGFNDLSGLFNLRLLGNSIQGSYLALHYGLRTRNQTQPEVRLSQQFAQASLQMYVIKHFGFDALYRSYLPVTDSTLGEVRAELTEGGAFIDFQNFRVFGSWYKETEKETLSGVENKKIRTGIRSGLKIFF